jgi:hypothetical protein
LAISHNGIIDFFALFDPNVRREFRDYLHWIIYMPIKGSTLKFLSNRVDKPIFLTIMERFTLKPCNALKL